MLCCNTHALDLSTRHWVLRIGQHSYRISSGSNVGSRFGRGFVALWTADDEFEDHVPCAGRRAPQKRPTIPRQDALQAPPALAAVYTVGLMFWLWRNRFVGS